MRFVIVNESPEVTEALYGGELTNAQLVNIACAMEVYATRDVGTHWGGDHTVRPGVNSRDVMPGEVVCAIVAALPSAPGAVAYHSIDGASAPVIFIARTQCSSIADGPGSVTAALSHEIAEAIGDEYVNAWRQDATGQEWAQELCDPVQERCYTVSGCSVADFVLPAFFCDGTTGPWSHLGARGGEELAGPFTLAPGGYAVVRRELGRETQIWGEMRPHAYIKKKNWNSRTVRRGAKL